MNDNDSLGHAQHMMQVARDALQRAIDHALERDNTPPGTICLHCGGPLSDSVGAVSVARPSTSTVSNDQSYQSDSGENETCLTLGKGD